MPLLGLTMLGPRHVEAQPLADDGHRPVIFVHGLGGHRGNFLPLRLFFRLNGRTRTYSASLAAGTDFDAMAVALRDFIDQVCRVNALDEAAQVDVVAHSLGGLIARLAIEDERVRARIATLVTLATPHGGTHAARFLSTPATLALRPDSELVKRLSAQMPWRGTPRLVTVWSRSDVILLPAQTAVLDGAEVIELEGFSHYGFLLKPSCFRRVFETLR